MGRSALVLLAACGSTAPATAPPPDATAPPPADATATAPAPPAAAAPPPAVPEAPLPAARRPRARDRARFDDCNIDTGHAHAIGDVVDVSTSRKRSLAWADADDCYTFAIGPAESRTYGRFFAGAAPVKAYALLSDVCGPGTCAAVIVLRRIDDPLALLDAAIVPDVCDQGIALHTLPLFRDHDLLEVDCYRSVTTEEDLTAYVYEVQGGRLAIVHDAFLGQHIDPMRGECMPDILGSIAVAGEGRLRVTVEDELKRWDCEHLHGAVADWQYDATTRRLVRATTPARVRGKRCDCVPE